MRLVWHCPRPVWAALAAACPQATIGHTPDWADGRRALLVVTRAPGGSATCGSQGGYGGLIANAPLDADEQRRLYLAAGRRFPALHGTSNPFAGPPPQRAALALTPTAGTRVLPLAPLERLRRDYAPERLRAVRHPAFASVTTRGVVRPGTAELDLFWDLHLQALEAACPVDFHPGRQQAWFTALWGQLPGLRLVLAELDGTPVGALLWVAHRRVATQLALVWDRRCAAYPVETALVEAGLAQAFAAGCQWWDFRPAQPAYRAAADAAAFGAAERPVWAFARRGLWRRMLTGWSSLALAGRLGHPAQSPPLPPG